VAGDGGFVSREERLGRTFVEIADTLVDDFDVVELLVLVAERCVELLDATAAGLLLADPQGRLRLMAATSDATELVELFQIQDDEGPCLECYRSQAPVLVPDIVAEAARWPRFAPVAAEAGFRGVHALPLRLRTHTLGALNLFREEPGRLGHDDVTAAQALADVATIALLQHRASREAQGVADQLRAALDSRIAIEQAKGVIAERAGIGMAEAFGRLRGYARSNQRLLADVARDVVEGTLPPGSVT
jgi:GAF domain-containing protein